MPRCDREIDDENQVFTSCAKLKNLHTKYETNRFEDVFENKNLKKLRKVAWFLRKANLESWVV